MSDDYCKCAKCPAVFMGQVDGYRERDWARDHGGFWVPEMGDGLCPAHV